MKVFKFGGASVKDANAVRNVAAILKQYSHEKLVVVISAMGKTTNALEEVHALRFHKKDYSTALAAMWNYHAQIGNELFGNESKWFEPVKDQYEILKEKLALSPTNHFDFEYDQVVCYGEIFSTALVHSYLLSESFSAAWMDVRQLIRTDNCYRDARVDWNRSAAAVPQLEAALERKDMVIVQGFIGSTAQNQSTTLGREGSDFTAAIIAYLLDAESVTIWKDVPGMLNADPKYFSDTLKLDRISFHEAIELAYCGASVIHPKTIKPLQNKNIPLYIKSFLDPTAEGSVIAESMSYDKLIPSFILRQNQVLVSISTKDYSFVVEDNLKEIFETFAIIGIRIHLMENSAISFSVCMDKDDYKMKQLFEKLSEKYSMKYNENLSLITIRHYNEATVQSLVTGKEILLEQRSRQTVRMVVR